MCNFDELVEKLNKSIEPFFDPKFGCHRFGLEDGWTLVDAFEQVLDAELGDKDYHMTAGCCPAVASEGISCGCIFVALTNDDGEHEEEVWEWREK